MSGTKIKRERRKKQQEVGKNTAITIYKIHFTKEFLFHNTRVEQKEFNLMLIPPNADHDIL